MEKQESKKRFKFSANNGVTLIALAVTIIVLIILASITIGIITGDNGVLTRAENAKNAHIEGSQLENNTINDYSNVIAGVTGNLTVPDDGDDDGDGSGDSGDSGDSGEHVHSFTIKIISAEYLKSAATCESAAVYYYKCNGCTEKGTNTFTYGNAIGHSWGTGTVTAEATCEAEGNTKYTCSTCGETKNVAIAKLAHSYTSQTMTAEYLKSEATCTAPAYYYYKCANCTAMGTNTYSYGDATGHTYDNGTITTEATCEAAGVKTYTCTKCGNTRTESIDATGHDFSSQTMTDAYLASEATCTGLAKYYYKCVNCSEHGESTYTTGTTLGHNWDA